MTGILGFLLQNGIGQNITAGVIMGAPAAVWGKRELLKLHRRHQAHERSLAALRAHLGIEIPDPPADT